MCIVGSGSSERCETVCSPATPPGVEAGAARVGLQIFLYAAGGAVEVWPFGLEEGEVAQSVVLELRF